MTTMTRVFQKCIPIVVFAAVGFQQPARAAVPPQGEIPPPPQAQRVNPNPITALKVEIVISRYESSGTTLKKISSLPYELIVVANEKPASLRMGGQMPMAGKDGAFQYLDVGTNIDCSARTMDDGRFKIEITVDDRSAIERRSGDTQLPGVPALRNFRTNNVLILRDGQSTQFTAATDKTSGEVVKVDVTVRAEK
jgi:hypothetical protein